MKVAKTSRINILFFWFALKKAMRRSHLHDLRDELLDRERRLQRRDNDSRRRWNHALTLWGGSEARGINTIQELVKSSRLSSDVKAILSPVKYQASGQSGDVFRTEQNYAIKLVDFRQNLEYEWMNSANGTMTFGTSEGMASVREKDMVILQKLKAIGTGDKGKSKLEEQPSATVTRHQDVVSFFFEVEFAKKMVISG